MLADGLSRLRSYLIDEGYLYEDTSKCYVKSVEGAFLVDTMNRIEDDALRKPVVDDLINEQRKDASCRILLNQIDDSDSPYLIDNGKVYQDVHDQMMPASTSYRLDSDRPYCTMHMTTHWEDTPAEDEHATR